MGLSVGAIIGLAISASAATTSTIQAQKSAQDSRQAIRKQEERLIEQQKIEQAEKKRAEKKVEDRKRAVTEEGRPSTFTTGQGGLTGAAPTKKKKLGQ